MDVRIFVNTLKKYRMPEDDIYIPIQVGAPEFLDIEGYLRDNTGDNISEKNITYSEYPAIYWIWKNIDHTENQVIGINQYRRYFTKASKFREVISKDKYSLVLKEQDIESIMDDGYDIILPRITNMGTENVRENYANSEHGNIIEIDAAGMVIKELCPEYYDSYEKVMNSHYCYLRSIFIMKRELFDKYCQWLFSVLFKIEEKYGFDKPRVYGFLAERLLNVFIDYEKPQIKELNYLNIEVELGLWYVGVLWRRLANRLFGDKKSIAS